MPCGSDCPCCITFHDGLGFTHFEPQGQQLVGSQRWQIHISKCRPSLLMCVRRLPMPVLHDIWEIADSQSQGVLSQEQFYNALRREGGGAWTGMKKAGWCAGVGPYTRNQGELQIVSRLQGVVQQLDDYGNKKDGRNASLSRHSWLAFGNLWILACLFSRLLS